MKQAKAKLTFEQFKKLESGGVLTIRLRDTELLLSAESPSTVLLDTFLDGLKNHFGGKL